MRRFVGRGNSFVIALAVLWGITGCGGSGGGDPIPPKDTGQPDTTEPDSADVTTPQCGNGECEEGEDKSSCPADCAVTTECGNGECEEGENELSCPADCETTEPVCGNGECEEGEDETSCPVDCEVIEPICGDGNCDDNEDETTCPEDCEETPPEECPTCPGGLCAWCDLANTACTILDLSSCLDAANDLAVAETVPMLEGQAIYPPCIEPVCGPAGTCSLATIPHCCAGTADCPIQTSTCFFTTCQLETSAPAHLSNNPPSYCQTQIVPGCCSTQSDTVVLAESFALLTDPLPAGWSTNDANTGDDVRWGVRIGDDLCYSGGHCLHLSVSDSNAPGAAYCNTYYNGEMQDCVPTLNPDAPFGSAINIYLESQQFALKPSDRPWVATFRLRMNAEAPVPDIGVEGDNLVMVVNEDGNATTVFNSASINNTTEGQWRLISVDLSTWHGKTISLGWTFDTKDGESNVSGPVNGVFEGVGLDDVTVTTTCSSSSQPCTSETVAECASADPCSEHSCAIFAPKTALSVEPESGFCYLTEKVGCQACAGFDDCDSPPETGGPYDADCVDGTCQYIPQNCSSETLLDEGFESGIPVDWPVANDATCDNYWTSTDLRSSAGTKSLHFGQIAASCDGDELATCPGLTDVCPSYDCGALKANGFISTNTVTLPPQSLLVLSFDLFLMTEFDGNPAIVDESFINQCASNTNYCSDRLVLMATYQQNEVSVEEMIWDSYALQGTTLCGWEPVSVNISGLQGKDVTFKWWFDTQDGWQNDFEGPYFDQVLVTKVCNEPCGSSTDCADLGLCTVAQCVQGECQYETQVDCCETTLDCGDENSCTTDTCSDQNQCVYTISSAVDCCEADAVYWTESFDGTEAPEGWTVEATGNSGVKWQWLADQGKDGSGAFYFGDSTKTPMTYFDEAVGGGAKTVSGVLLTPPLAVPPGGVPSLRFDLYLDTEFSSLDAAGFQSYFDVISLWFFDRLAVYASTDGGQTFTAAPIWRSEDDQPLKGATVDPDGNVVWMDLGFSLANYAGNSQLVLKFEFDSYTGADNDHMGVLLDNVRISQVCSSPLNPDPCVSDAWCEDGDGCSWDSCTAGECASIPAEGKAGCCFPQPIVTYGYEQAGLLGWTIDQTTDPGHWEVSNLKSSTGNFSLHFGNPSDGTYSGCSCASPDACDGACPPTDCVVPKGTATSPPFVVQSGHDYQLSFDLFADLSIQEGYLGWPENFTVKLLSDTPSGVLAMATLVCHAGECDVPGDICASGVNFSYPGCGENPIDVANGIISNYGDYGHWVTKSFLLSDVLCSVDNTIAATFVQTLQTTGTNTFWLEVYFKANDNIDNCGSGLYIDNLTLSETCNDWGQCT